MPIEPKPPPRTPSEAADDDGFAGRFDSEIVGLRERLARLEARARAGVAASEDAARTRDEADAEADLPGVPE